MARAVLVVLVVLGATTARAESAPSDPLYARQWALSLGNVPAAWAVTRGSPSVLVGVVDTSFDVTHTDKPACLAFHDETGTGSGVGSAHGTHVTGIVAAPVNGRGVVGVAPETGVVFEKGAPSGYAMDDDAYARALRRLTADPRVRVINLSQGTFGTAGGAPRRPEGEVDDPGIRAGVAEAVAAGKLVVAAAGNEPDRPPEYPAAYPGVLSAGASGPDGKPAWYNSPGYALLAPGGDPLGKGILSTTPDNQYGEFSGTSMAAPFVSGVAALMFTANTTLTAERARAILLSTAKDGLVDAGAAVNAAASEPGAAQAPHATCATGSWQLRARLPVVRR